MTRAAQRHASDSERGSGKQKRNPEPRYLVVGQIVGAHGLHGEIKVALTTDDPYRFGVLERIYIGPEDMEPESKTLEHFRLHKGQALLQVEGCSDRTSAQRLQGLLVQVPLAEAIPLEAGEYFEHQIVGLEVWTVAGARLGKVTDIIYTGANEVYVVSDTEPNRREVLVPAIENVVHDIDLDAGRITVELPDGLL